MNENSNTVDRTGRGQCAGGDRREQKEMIKPESPCLGCIERQFGCHSGCRDYQEYLEINKKYKELVREGKRSEFREYLAERWSRR